MLLHFARRALGSPDRKDEYEQLGEIHLLDRALIIDRLRKEIDAGKKASILLDAMFDRARRHSEFAADLQRWIDKGDILSLRRAAAPFGDFSGNRVFAGKVYQLDAAMAQARSDTGDADQ
ncbi:hypothetical protein KO516_06965 [Citreicella sp. C3M06]|uniref:hypothetical protein n=1 Tax=Roseobacteraceae TaxID=2854170 RepID=UPI001C09F493|nr:MULTISPECIES: hypothetical protein [Roseobacteraceae]MBU2960558.1 hypothetical protein [Citreicella sp. C3M06]MDO6588222.1 hypothetical protein [Salipiger sp. 1_MG-2023]